VPDTGTALGVDLYGLLKAGKDHLPTVAGQYRKAVAQLDQAEGGVPTAFSRLPSFGGGMYGPAYQPWRDLRDELDRALSQTASNLDATAEALVVAAVEYARSDRDAAEELDRLRRLSGEPHIDRDPLPGGLPDPASGGSPTR
jgi:hypothetical protein